MEALIGKSVRGPVVEVRIPQALRCDPEPLPLHFAVENLDSDFVPGDFELFDSGSDDARQFLCDLCAFARIVGGSLQLFVENFLHDDFCFAGVEALIFLRLQLVSIHPLSHFVSFNYVYKISNY